MDKKISYVEYLNCYDKGLINQSMPLINYLIKQMDPKSQVVSVDKTLVAEELGITKSKLCNTLDKLCSKGYLFKHFELGGKACYQIMFVLYYSTRFVDYDFAVKAIDGMSKTGIPVDYRMVEVYE